MRCAQERHRQERQEAQQKELQDQLQAIRDEHETAKKAVVAEIAKGLADKQTKLGGSLAELEEEKATAVAKEQKLLSYELEKAEAEHAREQTNLVRAGIFVRHNMSLSVLTWH